MVSFTKVEMVEMEGLGGGYADGDRVGAGDGDGLLVLPAGLAR